MYLSKMFAAKLYWTIVAPCRTCRRGPKLRITAAQYLTGNGQIRIVNGPVVRSVESQASNKGLQLKRHLRTAVRLRMKTTKDLEGTVYIVYCLDLFDYVCLLYCLPVSDWTLWEPWYWLLPFASSQEGWGPRNALLILSNVLGQSGNGSGLTRVWSCLVHSDPNALPLITHSRQNLRSLKWCAGSPNSMHVKPFLTTLRPLDLKMGFTNHPSLINNDQISEHTEAG